MFIQHAIVLTLVGGCVAYIARGAFRTLTAKRSQLGNCCTTGCSLKENRKQQGGSEPRLHFIPVENLRRVRR